jgi:coproporphyrinogen III oxidase-like Fe-S oxidoreductase
MSRLIQILVRKVNPKSAESAEFLEKSAEFFTSFFFVTYNHKHWNKNTLRCFGMVFPQRGGDASHRNLYYLTQ